MTRDDVVHLARSVGVVVETGLAPCFYSHAQLEEFATKIRNAALEEAAKRQATRPKMPQKWYMSMSPIQIAKANGFGNGFKAGAKTLREAIRSMKS